MRTAERWGARAVDLETTLRIPENKRDEFLQTVAPSAPAESAAVGGTAEFFLSLSDPGLILWIERWPTRDALIERLETNAFRVLMGAAKTLGRVLDIRIVDDPRFPAQGSVRVQLHGAGGGT